MIRLNLIFVTILFFSIGLIAQEKKEEDKTIKISWSGYVKYDAFFDSRQVLAAREGHLMLWPKAPEYDENGNDINASPNFNFLAIQTRLKTAISGPDALGAKTSAMIEAEFFGHTDADINGYRLRHATINLDWEKSGLMMGQFWHPMFALECFPGTVSFNTGMSFAPFSRNPLIKYYYKLNNLKLAITAYSERDFSSKNINGIASPDYIRNSKTPGLNVHLNYTKSNKDKNTSVSTGIIGNWHSMLPELKTSANYITKQLVESYCGAVYLNLKLRPINFKISGVYVENSSGIMMPGGYAVHRIIDPVNQEKDYVPTRNIAGWIDISTTSKKWQPGIFAGYNKNLGTAKSIIDKPGGHGVNIAYIYRISPRLNYYINNLQFAAELDITAAAFGDNTYSDKAIPLNAKEVINYRVIFGAYYHF